MHDKLSLFLRRDLRREMPEKGTLLSPTAIPHDLLDVAHDMTGRTLSLVIQRSAGPLNQPREPFLLHDTAGWSFRLKNGNVFVNRTAPVQANLHFRPDNDRWYHDGVDITAARVPRTCGHGFTWQGPVLDAYTASCVECTAAKEPRLIPAPRVPQESRRARTAASPATTTAQVGMRRVASTGGTTLLGIVDRLSVPQAGQPLSLELTYVKKASAQNQADRWGELLRELRGHQHWDRWAGFHVGVGPREGGLYPLVWVPCDH